ncbi:MAG: BTAD domain-containing putative transcriptional regulator [Streptosporangiaceae bacterium]
MSIAAGGTGAACPDPGVISIWVLGRFAVRRGEADIPLREFGGRLAQQLLRLLALQRGALLPKDVIAGALWPQHPPTRPRANIEVLVSRIRRALGDRTLIQTGPGGYCLAGDGRCQVDAEAFLDAVQAGRHALGARPAEALTCFREALCLWRGEPLAEDAYALWAQDERQCLALAYLEALEGAAAAALDAGDPADAVSYAGRALSRDRLRESAAMLLVQALAAGGDRAVALAEFDAFRQRLASEAGLDPSPAAQELRQRVLLSRPRPEPAGIAAAARPQGTFAGRGPECAQIAATAAGSGPRLLLVTGPPGVGKSRLLAEAAQAARVPVLSAQAVPGDRDDAWALAGRLLRQAADLAHAAGIGLAEAGALADITAPQALAFMPAAAAAERRALATRAAVRLAEAVAQPRCLIVADDLHWADRESLGLLGLLLRRTDRISIVGSCRPDAAGPGWSAAAALGVPATEAAHIALGPLLPEAFRRLLADPVLAEAILDQACRTPFAATEIVAALARDGTLHWDDDGLGRLQSPAGPERAHAVAAAGIAGALDSRLVGLPAGQRQLVCLLAALGRPAPAALLADACGTDSRDVLTLLEALARAGMTRDGPRGCGLRGEALGRAVAGTLGPAEKAYAHGLLARALQRAGADPAEVAAHLAGSGDRDAAALAYAAAARSQLARRSDADAVRLAEAGLSLKPAGRARARLLEARAEAHRRRGRTADARVGLAAALDSLDDPAGRSRILAELGVLEARSASLERGQQLIELAIAEAGDQPAALGRALAAAAIIDLPAGNLRRARHRFRRAGRLLEEAGDRQAAARQLYWRAMTGYMNGQLREAVTQLGHLARLPAAPAELLRFWSPQATLGHALAFLGEIQAGLAEIGLALQDARASGYLALESECLWRRGEALAFGGQSAQAVEAAQQAVVIAARIGHVSCLASSLRGLGIAWEAAGRLDRAEAAFRRSLQAGEDSTFFSAWASARLGACLTRQGRLTEAAGHVHAAMTGGTPLTRHEARWAHAELLAAAGDTRARQAAAGALLAAEAGGYLILVPRLRELADGDPGTRKETARNTQAPPATLECAPLAGA